MPPNMPTTAHRETVCAPCCPLANHSSSSSTAVILTAWHLIFATMATQILAHTTTLLDSRHKLPMTNRLYLRTILPIGLFYSGSLVCSNLVYLYLSVAFIQMLKSAAPVAVLFFSWLWGVADPTAARLANIVVIVAGVALASAGEIQFSWVGFGYQLGGIVFEAIRLVMIQVMLSSEGLKMDPLVGLYYFAPVCAVMNVMVAWSSELWRFQWADAAQTGWLVLLANAMVAFMLNIASVFLVCAVVYRCQLARCFPSSDPSADRQNLWPRHDLDGHPEEHPPRDHLRPHLEDRNLSAASPGLQHRSGRPRLLLPGQGSADPVLYHGHGVVQHCLERAADGSWRDSRHGEASLVCRRHFCHGCVCDTRHRRIAQGTECYVFGLAAAYNDLLDILAIDTRFTTATNSSAFRELSQVSIIDSYSLPSVEESHHPNLPTSMGIS